MPEATPSASALASTAPASSGASTAPASSGASAAPPGRVLFDRAFLDHLNRALLCRLLTPWSAALAALGVPLDDLRATAQGDRRLVEKLFDAAHRDAIPAAPFPADLRALFITLAPYATATAQAAILRRDAASPEPRFRESRLPPADLVTTVHLEAPHLLQEVRVATDAEPSNTFTDFSAASPRALLVTPAALAAFEAALFAWLIARGRTRFCRVRVTEMASEILFVIEFCAPASSFDMVDVDLTLTQINGNTTDRALVLFDKLSSGLAVQGWTSMKDALRRFVGVCFFGDAGHFGVGAVYSLEPLRHLDVALDPRGIPGLEGIELREIALVNPDNSIRSYSWSNGDLRGSNNDAEIRAALATMATIASVKLYLKIAGRTRPTAVTLTANRKKFLRRATDVERVLDELLLARGIMKLPARASTATEIASMATQAASIAPNVVPIATDVASMG